MDVRAHAQAMEQVGAGILQVAAAEERKLDAQLKDLENLGEFGCNLCSVDFDLHHQFRYTPTDEDDFEALRQRRRLNLQKKMKMEQDWKQLGHGR